MAVVPGSAFGDVRRGICAYFLCVFTGKSETCDGAAEPVRRTFERVAEKIENMNAGSEADCECPFYKAAAGEVKADSAALLRY